jgi:phage replication initiation protein
MQNRFLIDWFSFSTKKYTVTDVIKFLGLEDVQFQNIMGQHGYKDRIYYESISIHYNGGPDMGVWCELTGKGCRAYETYGNCDYDFLFKLALSGEINVTRLDIAYDDFQGIFDMEKICLDTQNQNYISKWRAYEVIYSNGGNSVLLGSRQSDALLRIYDKSAEQKLKDKIHWVRLELQLRDERALGFLKSLSTGLFNLGYIYLAVINNYLRYVVPTNDTNNRRWPNTDYWDCFIKDADKLSIFEKPGTEYSFDALYDYVIRQNGNAIHTFIKMVGHTNMVEYLKDRGTRPNPKYEKLFRDYMKTLKVTS